MSSLHHRENFKFRFSRELVTGTGPEHSGRDRGKSLGRFSLLSDRISNRCPWSAIQPSYTYLLGEPIETSRTAIANNHNADLRYVA